MQQAVYGRFHTDDIVPANEVNTFMRQLITDKFGIPFNSRVDRKNNRAVLRVGGLQRRSKGL